MKFYILLFYLVLGLSVDGQVSLNWGHNDIKYALQLNTKAKITSDSLIRIDSFSYRGNEDIYFDSIYSEIKASINGPNNLEIEYYFNKFSGFNSCDSIIYKFKDSINFNLYRDSFLKNEFSKSKKLTSEIYIIKKWSSKITYPYSLRWFYSSIMMKIDKTPAKPYYATISFVFSPYLTRRNWKKLAR